MFDFFDEYKPAPGTISADRAIEIGRDILTVLKLKYDAQDGVGGIVGALAVCCAEAKLRDGKTPDEVLAAVHASLDQCFRRLKSFDR